MKNKKKTVSIIIWLCLVALFIVLSIALNGSYEKTETVKEVMRDAVLHGDN